MSKNLLQKLNKGRFVIPAAVALAITMSNVLMPHGNNNINNPDKGLGNMLGEEVSKFAEEQGISPEQFNSIFGTNGSSIKESYNQLKQKHNSSDTLLKTILDKNSEKYFNNYKDLKNNILTTFEKGYDISTLKEAIQKGEVEITEELVSGLFEISKDLKEVLNNMKQDGGFNVGGIEVHNSQEVQLIEDFSKEVFTVINNVSDILKENNVKTNSFPNLPSLEDTNGNNYDTIKQFNTSKKAPKVNGVKSILNK